MENILLSIVAFIVALGILVTAHEFGHFWVARRAGVKVLRFSVGFGKPLWRYQKTPDDTEYVVAAIPLGGYVRMLDEREDEVPPEMIDQAFNRKPLGHRFAIVAAGPIFNLLLAVIVYWMMFIVGVPGIKAIVDDVDPGSIAARAGVMPGSEIIAVDGEMTPTWGSASMAVVGKMLSQPEVVLTIRNSADKIHDYVLPLPESTEDFGKKDALLSLGIRPWVAEIPAVIGKLNPGSPADLAGVETGDHILRINGQDVEDWASCVKLIRPNYDQSVELSVERDGKVLQLSVVPEKVGEGDEAFGRIGVMPESRGVVPDEVRSYDKRTVLEAIPAAVVKTWDMSMLTLRVLGKMVVGEVSLDNVSGPITIAQYAGYSAVSGVASFLAFLAVISLSLAVLNLLPIPMLDGGHLFYYTIEFIKGSPLSESAQMLGQRIGIVLLVMLMSLAFYNDLLRLFG